MKRQSTKCTWTTTGEEIKEGDILGYGDNYPCIVIYNTFEAKFEAIEFGYMQDEGYLYRVHELRYQTVPWKILGTNKNLLKEYTHDFSYIEEIKKYYE